MVRPRALAVLRLMTRSNLVGCSTGESAGLTPGGSCLRVGNSQPKRLLQVGFSVPSQPSPKGAARLYPERGAIAGCWRAAIGGRTLRKRPDDRPVLVLSER